MSIFLTIPPSQHMTVLAFKRLIRYSLKKMKQGHTHSIKALLYLGAEHGFCHDDTNELILDCQREMLVGSGV